MGDEYLVEEFYSRDIHRYYGGHRALEAQISFFMLSHGVVVQATLCFSAKRVP